MKKSRRQGSRGVVRMNRGGGRSRQGGGGRGEEQVVRARRSRRET